MLRLLRSFRRDGWFLGLLLAGLLALGGCGSGAASNSPGNAASTATPTAVMVPTPASIAGWQTYSDTQYQFTIQYPPNWTAQLAPPAQNAPSNEIISFFPADSASGSTTPTQNVISITITTGSANAGDATPPGFTSSGSVPVDGMSEPLLSGPTATGGQGLLVVFSTGDQHYLFASSADAANASMFHDLFIQILSTFQFLASY